MDPEAYFSAMEHPGYELLIFAPRGTGASSHPEDATAYKIADYVDDIEALRIHLGVDRLTLYGNSHGAMVVLAYGGRYPDRVARLVMVNGPPNLSEEFMTEAVEARRKFSDAIADGAERLVAADVVGEALDTDTDEAERQFHFRTFMASYVAREGPAEGAYLDQLCSAPMNWEAGEVMYEELLGGLNLLDDARNVTAPGLVIGGEFDVTVPSAASRWVADALPRGRFVEMRGVGHFVEVEAPERLREIVCEFLAE
jgi:pimeloyl-ACP methyl ester carboxylesterase